MIRKSELMLVLIASICIGYSIFIHFSFANTKDDFVILKETIKILETRVDFPSLNVESLVCQNIKVVDDSGTTVVKIGKEDNETHIIVLDENEKPSIELIDGSGLNRITLNESDESETLITIGDHRGKTIPMFAVGRFINERDYLEKENLDNISGPSMFLSDEGNDAVFQAFISSDTAQILVGNGGIQSYIQSGTVSSADFAEIGIASKDKSLIGMRTEISDSDNVYHYVNHYDNGYSAKLGIWDDAVGFYTHNYDDKIDSCFLGYPDTDNINWSPVLRSYINDETSYDWVIKKTN